MKIGIDASRLAAGQRTGTENYALQLIRGLAQTAQPSQQLELYFNQPPRPAVLQALELDGQAEIKAMPFPRLWTHARLSYELLRHPPDRLLIPAHVLPLYHPQNSVVTIHDLGYLYFPDAHTSNARRYLDLSTRWSATRARRIIAVSQATKSDLMRHYSIPQAKITVIYHGYDRQHFQPVTDPAKRQLARARYGVGAGRFLLYIGTIQPRKNLLRLLEAFERLAAEPDFADLQLVIGGKPGWLSEPFFKAAARLQAVYPGRLHLPGYLDEADIPALLSEATAFVFPSLYEGFGMPVLEAMACGCPVVCSNSSSLPEVAGDAALYHHPLDSAALTSQLRRLLAQPELTEELRRKGFLQTARFSWERCVNETWEVFKIGNKI